MTANGSKYIDEVLFFGQRRFYAELYLSNNPEERRVRPCIGPTGSIRLIEQVGRRWHPMTVELFGRYRRDGQ
jgi:hypothetical protein